MFNNAICFKILILLIMPAHCCAFGCKSRLTPGTEIKFFRIPKDNVLRGKWVSAIKRENWSPSEHSRLCSKHFITGQPSRDLTNPDCVPSIFSYTPNKKKDAAVLQNKVQRHQRLIGRKENISRTESAKALLCLGADLQAITPGISTQTDNAVTREMGTQTDITLPIMNSLVFTNQVLKSTCDDYAANLQNAETTNNILKAELQQLQDQLSEIKKSLTTLEEENKLLKEEISKSVINSDSIINDDTKTKFYTGLPNYNTFLLVFEEANKHIRRKNTKLRKKDELLVTLIKLRRNLAMVDLAYRFNVSVSSITNIFHAWLDALFLTLGGLVKWPESDTCQLPQVFQNEMFQKVKCVIDCTEIFIDRPSNLKARAQTYSNYKRHNTIKLLVGVSPTGCVTFLSQCWGGRVSDRQITVESGILDKLLPGDVILADRGFNMNEDFAIRGAKLIVPAFTRGKKQLSKQEVEQSRMMSRARIHIERVIGRLKDFEIMKGPIPVALIKKCSNNSATTGDKIVHVVAAIINTNGPIL